MPYASDGLLQEYYDTIQDEVLLAELEIEVTRYLDDYPNATIEEICASLDIALMFDDTVQVIIDRWKEKQ